MTERPCNDTPNAGCGRIAFERNRYFTGKYMTARDFSDEQGYFLSRHRLHNRFFHGWGVACGLGIVPHPDAACRERWVVVRAGLALDCCGRELFLPRNTPFELPLPPDADEGEEGTESDGKRRCFERPFLLCLRYAEEEVEPVPALYAEGDCDPRHREANRVREAAELVACSLDEVGPGCWLEPGGGEDLPCRDDCDDDPPGPAGVCLDPRCPCGERVPLALVRPCDPEASWASGFEIDTLGVRRVAVPAGIHTHVAAINWPHGGEVSLRQLREEMGGRLTVRFDRQLLPAEGEATGIGEHTFAARYGGVQQDLEFLASPEEAIPRLEDGCLAVYPVDPSYLKGKRNIAGNMVYVTLRCDFVLDCHGIPVDGDHLKGRLPSGNGVPGGTFESWFRVVAGEEG